MTDREEPIRGTIVHIYGDEYQISSQCEVAEVQRIAAYVDQKMRSLAAQHSGRVPKASLAVLAAMEIASELFGTVQEQNRLTERARESLDRLTRLVGERSTLSASLLERRVAPVERFLREQLLPQQNSASSE